MTSDPAQPLLIAIDGPAASGKGTIAKRLAARYGLPHLDTGLLYRGVAAALLAAGEELGDVAAGLRAADALTEAALQNPALRSGPMSEAASVVAALPKVRERLLAFQLAFAARPTGALLDGRDIGTVICPSAPVKLFVTASVEERARRRALEMAGRGEPADEAEIRQKLIERDARDRDRAASPLMQADDAELLDTTKMSIEQAVEAATAIVERKRR